MVETTTIEVRQQNPDETDSPAQYESPESEDVCASYFSRQVSEQLGEYASLTISDSASVEAQLDYDTKNYAIYETPSGVVEGLYISHDVFTEDTESPESIGLTLSESDEEAFDESMMDEQEAAEQEADALLGGSDDSDEELGLAEE